MKSDRDRLTEYGDGEDTVVVRRALPSDWVALDKLWRDCFHDSDAFMEFYWKTAREKRKILMLEEHTCLKAMLHMNHYRIKFMGKEITGVYVVGVATVADYRHRKAMTRLIIECFCEAWEKRIPFVYLMPADEAIYRPFQFAYMYAQLVEKIPECPDWNAVADADTFAVSGKNNCPAGFGRLEQLAQISIRPAESAFDRERIAEAANGILSEHYDVYTLRNGDYYRQLQMENRAEGGDLLMLYAKGVWIGYFSYAKEDKVEIQEIACSGEWRRTVSEWLMRYFCGLEMELLPLEPEGFFFGRASVQKFHRPIIMGRIVHLQEWVERMPVAKMDFSLYLEIQDSWISENRGCWLWEARDGKNIFERSWHAPDAVMGIDAFLQWQTGYAALDELMAAGALRFLTDCGKMIRRIRTCSGFFINEIV